MPAVLGYRYVVADVFTDTALFARAGGSAERLEKVEVCGSAVIVARGELRL